MSIRLRLLIGGLALTMMTVFVGALAIYSKRYSNSLADQTFAEGLVPSDRLGAALAFVEYAAREAAVDAMDPAATIVQPDPNIGRHLDAAAALVADVLSGVSNEEPDRGFHDALSDALAHLNRLQIDGLAISERLFAQELAEATYGIERALADRRRSTDGLRTAIATEIDANAQRMLQISALAVLLSIAITLLMARSISARLLTAVRVAEAIASGKLDNEIDDRGRGEAAALLTALKTVQTSIAEQFARIEQLRRKQATSYVETISIQNARFQAALDNMSQGLCLFDRDLRLIVYNSRFVEMFGERELGLSAERIKQDEYLRPALASTNSGTFIERMPDGRTVALSRRGVIGGGFVVTMEDITERYREDEIMRHLARHDPLTDLPNRMQFREHLERRLTSEGATVFGLDLDGFKAVNDTLGHPVGDKLLRAVAERLSERLEPGAMLARVGGDEFAMVTGGPLPDAQSLSIARGLIDTIGKPFTIEGHEISIGVSIGIASHAPDATPSLADEMIVHVDLALYVAKAEGKNTSRFFQREMSDRLQRRRELETDLRSAVERGEELELFYQPFIEATNGRISGFEALLRWRHPRAGMVSPGEFVPIAEDVGLIHKIGLWALRAACVQAREWPEHLTISVNLSPVQFRNEHLLERVCAIVEETGIDPRRLQLEVTESLMLENPDGVLATLNAFRSQGIRISMDDFGTGYSSLGYLTRYPFDKVKIDQSFVRDMHIPQNLAVIRSVISLCGALGMSAIAEGVETEAQYRVLHAEGCPEMQGYHFSRPVPVADIPPLLLKTFAASLSRPAEASQGRAAGTAG